MVWSRLCLTLRFPVFSLQFAIAVSHGISLCLKFNLAPSPLGLSLGPQKWLSHLEIWELSNSSSTFFYPPVNTVMYCEIEIVSLPLLMLLPHLTDIQVSSPLCFSRPMVLPNFLLSVFIKLLKILITLQSSHFNFLNIMLCWWVTKVFPVSLNAFYLWKLSSLVGRLDRVPFRCFPKPF